MQAFATWVIRYRGLLLAAVVLFSVVAAWGYPVATDDDVIRFLPVDDPEVKRLEAITERFGSTNIVLVGVESDDIYTADRLRFVRGLTDALKKVDWVNYVTSVSHLSVMGAGNALTKIVPDPVPSSPEELATAKTFIQGLDYIIGALISESGRSTRLIVQLRTRDDDGNKVSPQRAAEAIRDAAMGFQAANGSAGVELHFGGAPFIAEAAARGTQEDLRRLAPYVVGLILLLIVLIVGTLRGALIIVVSVGISIGWTVGVMGLLGSPFTLISTSLPVILFALGSAYAVHLLVWYLEHDNDVENMLREVGWPVLVTALTTMAGFASFLLMDLAPMREFGWQMVLGTGMCVLVALIVIPVTLSFWPLKKVRPGTVGRGIDRGLQRLVTFSRRQHRWVLGGAVVGSAFLAAQIPQINTNMDPQSFFPAGSDPDRANAFMKAEFGASVFLSVMVEADLTQPAVIKRLAAFEDRVSALDGVASVNSIAQVLAITGESMGGRRLLSYKQDENAFLGKQARGADGAVRLLVDEAWQAGMVQVGISASDSARVAAITESIRDLAATHLAGHAGFQPRGDGDPSLVYQESAERLHMMVGSPAHDVAWFQRLLNSPLTALELVQFRSLLTAAVETHVMDGFFDLKTDVNAEQVVDHLIAEFVDHRMSEGSFMAYARTLAAPAELEAANRSGFERGVGASHEAIRNAAFESMPGAWVRRVEQATGPLTAQVRHRVAQLIDECFRPVWAVGQGEGGGHPIEVAVSGMPVIEEAMTRSVKRNQIRSLLFSLPLVLLILCLVFQSVSLGVIALVPTLVTLCATFGWMGLAPDWLPLDIGASMIASIGLGVGIDYAIHFLWRYRQEGIEGAMATTGRSIVVNAAEITAGFSVLACATISPMAKFGILTAETLLVAGTASLLLLPALLEVHAARKDKRPARG